MDASEYRKLIPLTLLGQTAELQAIPVQRLDWSGSGAVLELYDKTSGPERDSIIRAMGLIIEEGADPPIVLAQVLDIATSLDLAQIEPSVQVLKSKPVALDPLVQAAIDEYLTFRQLNLRLA
jgi:hypothetical protein